jgi:hypothetical protein
MITLARRNWVALLFLFLVFLITKQAEGAQIALVSARDHIEGSMTADQTVYADGQRIYLATFQGKLFVLARDRSADFPVLEVVQDTLLPLTAVRGDRSRLYVTSTDGNLRVYRKEHPLVLVATIPLSTYGLSSLALMGGKLYVAKGQARLAVDEDHVYLFAFNEGDIGLEVRKDLLTTGLIYGQTFEPNTTVVFDRASGDRLAGIPGGLNLYADGQILVQTIPGCCGPGISLYDPETLALEQFIARPFTNTVVRRGRWLIAGNEGGQVDVFDLQQNPSPFVSSADLRQLTGHTGSEDIEIRALWADEHDNLLFAARGATSSRRGLLCRRSSFWSCARRGQTHESNQLMPPEDDVMPRGIQRCALFRTTAMDRFPLAPDRPGGGQGPRSGGSGWIGRGCLGDPWADGTGSSLCYALSDLRRAVVAEGQGSA